MYFTVHVVGFNLCFDAAFFHHHYHRRRYLMYVCVCVMEARASNRSQANGYFLRNSLSNEEEEGHRMK